MGQVSCPQCGKVWAASDAYCPSCGVTLAYLNKRLPPADVEQPPAWPLTAGILIGLLVLGSGFLASRCRQVQARHQVIALVQLALGRHGAKPELVSVSASVVPAAHGRGRYDVRGTLRAPGALYGRLEGQWNAVTRHLAFRYDLRPDHQSAGNVLYRGAGTADPSKAACDGWTMTGGSVAAAP